MSYHMPQTSAPGQWPTLVTPTCQGIHMHTTQDHLRLVEEAFSGRVSSSEAALKITPDLPGHQRPKDGDVFVWVPPNTTDNEPTLKSTSLILQDWNDGMQWLPPAVFGPYMIYYELPRDKPESTTLTRTILPVMKHIPRIGPRTLGNCLLPPQWRLVYVIAYRSKCLARTKPGDPQHIHAAGDTALRNVEIYWLGNMVPKWTRKEGWRGAWYTAAQELAHTMPIHDPFLRTTELMQRYDIIHATQGSISEST